MCRGKQNTGEASNLLVPVEKKKAEQKTSVEELPEKYIMVDGVRLDVVVGDIYWS